MPLDPKRRIEAEEFVMCDVTGSPRAALKMTVDGPGLFLYDQSGNLRLGLVAEKDAPGLALFDSLGRPRVSLAGGGRDRDHTGRGIFLDRQQGENSLDFEFGE